MQEAIDKSNKAQRILVVGATGKQGGAVARHLLNNGFEVRALTRNQESPAASRLAAAGAIITVGDLEDVESLVKAMAGVGGVFSIQNYWAKGVGYEGEIRQGKNLANAAKRADVRHFVQSTMADGQAFPQQLQHFRSKATVDQHIKTLQLPYTFLGTVTFMDNVVDPDFGGSWTFPFISGVMSPQVPYHMLAVDDIGGVAAAVFANPVKYIGKKINITSDRLTVAEMKQLYKEVTGRSAKRFVLPAWLCRWLNREFVEQLQWQSAGNWTFGPEEAKEIYPNLTSFRAFLRMHQVVDL
ncbi:MAG: NmrA/HSCARG family protein [Phormidesmis sp.]